jgi:hypothetical protein
LSSRPQRFRLPLVRRLASIMSDSLIAKPSLRSASMTTYRQRVHQSRQSDIWLAD